MVRGGVAGRPRRVALARGLRAAAREPRALILIELSEAGGLTPAELSERRPDLAADVAYAERHVVAMWNAGLVRPRGTADDALGEAPYVLSRTGEAVTALARELLRM